ncbi:MAG: outer membrane protein assembly factor BamB [Gammaproteobacteria bacterium]|nr:outer membrane protein assembly factor BamB [Gammaproteobacteria bacterium]
MKVTHSLLLIAVCGLLAACATPDNAEPPAPLTEISEPASVRELWSIDTGEGIVNNFYNMQPLVLDDVIYTIDTRGLIYAIDADSGKAQWSYKSGLAAITGLSGNSDGLLASSRDGELVMLEFSGESLQPRWRIQLPSEIRSKAIIDGNQVFVRTIDGKLNAINADSGVLAWSVSRRVPALSLTGNSYPVISRDLVISGFDDGKLVAFERDNGSTVWETQVTTASGRTEIERLIDLDGQFLLRDGVVYVSSYQGNLAAISAANGQVIWSREFSSFQAIEADREALYLTDVSSHLWSIDRRTGSAFWKQDVLNARNITAPRLLGNRLVVADLEGYVHWFDKQDGRLLARSAPHEQRYLAQPVSVDDRVMVLDSNNQLTALTIEN